MFYIIKRNKIRLLLSFILFLLSIGILCYLMLCSDISNIQFFVLISLFCCFFSKSLYTVNVVFSKIQGNEKKYELIPFLNIFNTILSEDFDNSEWKSWNKNKIGFYFYSGDINKIKNLPVVIKSNFKFGLYEDEECTKLIKEFTSDKETGTILFEDMRYSTTYIKELEAPKNYQLSDKVLKLEINDKGVFLDGTELTEENDTYSFEFENTRIPKVQTGNETNYILLAIIIVISISLIIAGVVILKRNNNI